VDRDTLSKIIALAKEVSGQESISADTAVHQDLTIAGGDVGDFVELIAEQYGDDVYDWPWDRFAIMTEGLSVFFLPALIWQLVTWPFRGAFGYPDDIERLTMGHIAKVIDAGHWMEP